MYLVQDIEYCTANSQTKKGESQLLVYPVTFFITSGLYARSNQGTKSSELTSVETHRLLTQEAKLQRHKRIVKSYGVVNPWERTKLHNETAKPNRNINKQKHDRQERK